MMDPRISESLIRDLLRELRSRPLTASVSPSVGHHHHHSMPINPVVNGHVNHLHHNGHHHHTHHHPTVSSGSQATVTSSGRRRAETETREQPSSSTGDSVGRNQGNSASGTSHSTAASQVNLNAKELERIKVQSKQLEDLLTMLEQQNSQNQLGHLWANNARPNDLSGNSLRNQMQSLDSAVNGEQQGQINSLAHHDPSGGGVSITTDSLIRTLSSSMESMNDMTRNILHRASFNFDGNQQLITLLLMQNQQLIYQQQQLLLCLSLNQNQSLGIRDESVDHRCCNSSSSSRRMIQTTNRPSCHSCHDPDQSPQQQGNLLFLDNVFSQPSLSCPVTSQNNTSFQTNVLSSIKRPVVSPNSSDGARGSCSSSSKLQLNNQVTPGVRANNYYDNFRSNTCQNQLSSRNTDQPASASNHFALNLPASTPDHILANQLQESLRLMDPVTSTPTGNSTTVTSNHNFHFESTPLDFSTGNNRHHPFALVPPFNSNSAACHRRQKKAANHTKPRIPSVSDGNTTWTVSTGAEGAVGGAGSSVLSLEKIIEKFMTEEKSSLKNQTTSSGNKKAINIVSATNHYEPSMMGAVGGISVEDNENDWRNLITSPSSSTGAVRKRPRATTLPNEVTSIATTVNPVSPAVTSSNSSSADTSISRGNKTPSHMTVPDPSPDPGEGEALDPLPSPAQCMRELSNKLKIWQESISNQIGGESSSSEATFIVASTSGTSPSSANNSLNTANETVTLGSGNQRRDPNKTVTVALSEEASANHGTVSNGLNNHSSLPQSSLNSNHIPSASAATGTETAESGQDEEEVDTDGRGYEQDDEDEEDDEDEIRFEGDGEQGL